MFGIKIPSLSVLKNPYVLGGLAAGAGLYFILTGSNTGFGPLDTGLRDIGNVTGIEGIFANKAPATLKDAPGKTTIVKTSPYGFAPFSPGAMNQGAGYTSAGGTSAVQFSGVGEFGSDDGRLTIA